MTLLRHNPRRDANELEIVRVFESNGCEVMRLNLFDLLVLKPNKEILMVEVKTPNGRLTKSQQDMLWAGWPLIVVRSADEARELVNPRGVMEA